MSEDQVPLGRARGRARGLETAMAGLRLGERRPGDIALTPGLGRGRAIPTLKGRGRGEASTSKSLVGSGESSNPSALSSGHLGSSDSSEGGPIYPLGRGATRGVRTRLPIALRTRPEELNKKRGAGGTPIDLLTNYFSLVQKPDWVLHQYVVTFKPDLEDPRVSLNSSVFSQFPSSPQVCNVGVGL